MILHKIKYLKDGTFVYRHKGIIRLSKGNGSTWSRKSDLLRAVADILEAYYEYPGCNFAPKDLSMDDLYILVITDLGFQHRRVKDFFSNSELELINEQRRFYRKCR